MMTTPGINLFAQAVKRYGKIRKMVKGLIVYIFSESEATLNKHQKITSLVNKREVTYSAKSITKTVVAVGS